MSDIADLLAAHDVAKGVLSMDEITKLVAGGRARNAYGPKLASFYEGDDAAINPAEFWPVEFGAKEASTLYQGFLGAIKKADLEGKVVVKQSDGKVFLMNMEKINAIMAAQLNGEVEVSSDETDSDPDAE